MHRAVGELGARISARELSEWAAFERIEGPLGLERADMQAAIVASVIANTNREKNQRPYLPYLYAYGTEGIPTVG